MLIIYAHPNKDGNCGYILKQFQKELKEVGTDYQVLDLYEMSYDPILKPEEHYTSGHRDVADDTKKIQEIIQNEDQIVVIYPTWWNGTPAILKGFFDRVLISGFAFKYINGLPFGMLKGKRTAVFTTTGGPAIYEKLLAGNRSLKVVVKDTLGFCGIKTKGYMVGSSNKFTEKNKKVIQKKVKSALNFL